MKFKTNINCGGCVSAVTQTLDTVVGEGYWKVDTQNPSKILTVTNLQVSENKIVEAVQKAGYKIEKTEF